MGGRLRWRQWAEGCGDGGGGESSSNGTTEDAEPRTKCPETPLCCPFCGEAIVIKYPTMDELLEEIAAAEPSAIDQDREVWSTWFWGVGKGWFGNAYQGKRPNLSWALAKLAKARQDW
ncbi:hypothetical protein C2845_PM02G32600 [Panicum miliaceum]|uniref:Uncharacterized protein n=1 Tax=Panicum miliaceum TaxID=4540 RepID=A0A3L6S6Y0_PANMI|nr:hypothetical protein C2845_PM02G32600 [Panicum miliaceum]